MAASENPVVHIKTTLSLPPTFEARMSDLNKLVLTKHYTPENWPSLLLELVKVVDDNPDYRGKNQEKKDLVLQSVRALSTSMDMTKEKRVIFTYTIDNEAPLIIDNLVAALRVPTRKDVDAIVAEVSLPAIDGKPLSLPEETVNHVYVDVRNQISRAGGTIGSWLEILPLAMGAVHDYVKLSGEAKKGLVMETVRRLTREMSPDDHNLHAVVEIAGPPAIQILYEVATKVVPLGKKLKKGCFWRIRAAIKRRL